MSNKLIINGWASFKTGVFIGLVCSIAMSFVYSGSTFTPSPPGFQEMFSNELWAFIVCIICWGAIGVLFSLTALIFKQTDWSITKMTLTHGVISYFGLVPIALYLRWIGLDLNGLVNFTIIYLIIYLILWLLSMWQAKREVRQINRMLK